MSIIETADKSITIGVYTFFIPGRRIIVESNGPKDEKELEVIAETYERWKGRYKHCGRPLNGEFRWCMNPKCNNAFYAFRFKIEQGQASFCCRRCSNKFTGYPRGQQIGKLINRPDRLTKIEAQKEKRQREQTEEKKEIPVVIALPISEVVAQLGRSLNEPRRIQLQCVKCKVIMDRIPGNPTTCPVCKEATFFIAVAAQEAPT